MSGLSTSKVSVTTAATLVLAADQNRISAFFLNDPQNSTDVVFFGNDNTVASSGAAQGIPVGVGVGIGYTDADAPHAIWAIAKSGTQTINVQVNTGP